MKVTGLLLVPCLISAVLGSPAVDYDQVVLGGSTGGLRNLEASLESATDFLSNAKKAILKGKHNLQKWLHNGREYIKQNGLMYELVSVPAFKEHQLRVTEPNLCDNTVKQYSGYLDVAEDKHLFFWFFESRSSPADAPLVLWLNGGPGCSSSTGLLFELGPCNIANKGQSTTFNPHSWNNNANIIFLDQPVNVGYSYADDGTTVSTSPVAGKDVYAFLELFLNRFPEYSTQPFHIAAESYGGTYAPNFANVIYKQNKQLALAPVPHLKHINLASVILANGLTDPYIQMASIPDYVCEELGLNPYDVRRKCDREKDGDLCYKQMTWIDTWMNIPANKAALGVNPDQTFASCNLDVNRAFVMQGDGMHNSALLLPELVNDGVRLLVYAGNADMMCNFIGNERWVEELDTKYQREFSVTKSVPWITSKSGTVAGEVRSAGGGGFTAGNVTFVTVFEAGMTGENYAIE
ncbi:hypothetical protein H0H87_001335 [Tephrocybe sp. NHM501043]|nr:hypothetical protein H0H87_001335 [Tephrocybe sp. NHM501043]